MNDQLVKLHLDILAIAGRAIDIARTANRERDIATELMALEVADSLNQIKPIYLRTPEGAQSGDFPVDGHSAGADSEPQNAAATGNDFSQARP